MALRDDLKNYVPMYLWEVLNRPEGYVVTAEEFNEMWNKIRLQNDTQANYIRDILLMLYETILHDTDGASHLMVDLPEFSASTLAQVLLLIDQRLKADAAALAAHKTSGDHDSRYYTEAELNAGQLDNRYYTEAELDNNKLGTLYYTKTELQPWLKGGDTIVREDVFTIVTSDNGDGTFTYSYGGENLVGALGGSGEQIFQLQTGQYTMESNLTEAIINDTLRRSVASGGIQEISPTEIALTSPEGAGAEITIRYYERIGIAAEYNIKLSPTKPPQNNGRTMWFKVI